DAMVTSSAEVGAAAPPQVAVSLQLPEIDAVRAAAARYGALIYGPPMPAPAGTTDAVPVSAIARSRLMRPLPVCRRFAVAVAVRAGYVAVDEPPLPVAATMTTPWLHA